MFRCSPSRSCTWTWARFPPLSIVGMGPPPPIWTPRSEKYSSRIEGAPSGRPASCSSTRSRTELSMCPRTSRVRLAGVPAGMTTEHIRLSASSLGNIVIFMRPLIT